MLGENTLVWRGCIMSYRRGSTIRKDVSDQRKERTHAKDPRTKTLDSQLQSMQGKSLGLERKASPHTKDGLSGQAWGFQVN